MEIAKKTTFYLIFLLIQTHQQINAVLLKEEAKILANGLIKTSKNLGKAGIEISQNVAIAATNAGLEATKAAAPAAIEAARVVGSEAAKNIGVGATQIVAPLAAVAVGLQVAHSAYQVGNAFVEWKWPSEEAQTRAQEVKEKLTTLTARKNFKECLLTNVDAPLAPSGRPQACERLAYAFAVAAGSNTEVEQLTAIYKQYTNQ